MIVLCLKLARGIFLGQFVIAPHIRFGHWNIKKCHFIMEKCHRIIRLHKNCTWMLSSPKRYILFFAISISFSSTSVRSLSKILHDGISLLYFVPSSYRAHNLIELCSYAATSSFGQLVQLHISQLRVVIHLSRSNFVRGLKTCWRSLPHLS